MAKTLLDWSDPAVQADPYPHYRRLRESDPIHFCRIGDGFPVWMIARYDDAVAILQDSRFITGEVEIDGSAAIASPAVPRQIGELLAVFRTMMPGRDGRDHARLRKSVNAMFNRAFIGRLRAKIQTIVDELVWQCTRGSTMDLISAVARPLPAIVMAGLLGLPENDHEQLVVLADDASVIADRTLRPSADSGFADPQRLQQFRSALHGARSLVRYFERILRQRRAEPRDDLLSGFAAAQQGPDGFSDHEIIAMCIVLLGAGQGTTRDMIGNGMIALLQHRQQKERLLAEPRQMPQAVEEMLRYDPSIQVAFRMATEDVEFHDTKFAKGDELNVLLGSANRDPSHFADPDIFDIDRSNLRHIAFGAGPHYCLGLHLTRLELELVFSTLLARHPEIALDRDDVERRPGYVFRGLKSLPLRLCSSNSR